MTQERVGTFIEMLWKEALFWWLSDDLFPTLRDIKTLGEFVKTKVPDKEDRIRMIYGWISSNIKYDKITSDNLFRWAELTTVFANIDNKYHSWIMTFKNKMWVCTGYSNLFYLIATYAGIDNIDIVLGKVYDKNYNNYVGHAWNKIGDYFYDTTYESTWNNLSSDGVYFFFKKTAEELYSLDKRIIDKQKLNPLKITEVK
jgi:transglutaminase/protease-like cytokinesis protein 3